MDRIKLALPKCRLETLSVPEPAYRTTLRIMLTLGVIACLGLLSPPKLLAQSAATMAAKDTLKRDASWQVRDASEVVTLLRSTLDRLGVAPAEMDAAADQFLLAVESDDVDPLDAYVESIRVHVDVVDEILDSATTKIEVSGQLLDPSTATYTAVESLPKSMRMSLRTWLGRELVRVRLYDEALPVIAEVDPSESIDPASSLFFRAACYHALLMKKESLADLRKLLENEEQVPIRFARTAKMMIADIKPLKEDSLDEISRLMTDVSRRLELGRSDKPTKEREQAIIDKLTKLIEKLEEQQKQQQQCSGGGSGTPSGGGKGKGNPMQDSQIADASGNGDVDRKKIDDRDGWGNLPPAERQQSLQQISRDLPTHYRRAIEAYFRKLATEG